MAHDIIDNRKITTFLITKTQITKWQRAMLSFLRITFYASRSPFHALRFMPYVLCFFIAISGWSSVSLTILRPKSNFNTSNHELTVEGLVESTKETEIVLSINTPAGVPELSEIGYSLHSVVLDLGSRQELEAILFTPYIHIDAEGDLFPYGPRKVKASFSNIRTDFNNESSIYVPSLGDPENKDRIMAKLGRVISGRYAQIEMLQGWQSSSDIILQHEIILKSIEFLNTSGQIIQPKIILFSILLFTDKYGEASFRLPVSLKEGRNRIVAMARIKDIELVETEEFEEYQDSQEVTLVYIPELVAENAVEGRFVLSDGDRATIILPLDSLDERIKRVRILSVPPDKIDLHSYLHNSKIVEGTSPIIVYKFESLRKKPFLVEASASMAEQPASLAVDGIYQPPSTWITGHASLPVEIVIDLGDDYVVSKIIVNSLVEDDKTYAPNRVEIYTSSTGKKESDFEKLMEYSDFADQITEIPLVTMPTFRWIKFVIVEGKQVNNIGINEIEFRDESDAQIISYYRQEETRLREPALMFLSYDEIDLAAANVHSDKGLAVFAYEKSPALKYGAKWRFVGGSLNRRENTITVQLNYLSQVALFQAVKPSEIEVLWSYNPFSPDGNGIADVTCLTLNLSDREIEKETKLVVEIFDITGKFIRTLVDRRIIESNSISIEWDGKDRNGKIVSIGPYIYQVQLGDQVYNGTIVVAK